MIRLILGAGAVWIAVAIALVLGWVLNIITLVSLATGPVTDVTLMFILRVVGIFVPPLGGVLGYL